MPIALDASPIDTIGSSGMKIRPHANRIIVRRIEVPKKIGLIHLPDVVVERLEREVKEGVVTAVGPGRYLKNGSDERLPVRVNVGDHVYFHERAGDEARITSDQSDHLFMWDDEVIAVKVP
jgi:co-chaperonin GroES (HSP10)